MPNIGPAEIFFVIVIALIVFGPERLPDIARKVGRAGSELRRMAAEVRSEFDMGLEDDEPRRRSGARAATTVEDEQTSDLDGDKDEDEDEEWESELWEEEHDQALIAEGLE
ncbi:MAG: Sec-independent protein translocase protein TatB, partial [Actinomycetota bacterium]